MLELAVLVVVMVAVWGVVTILSNPVQPKKARFELYIELEKIAREGRKP